MEAGTASGYPAAQAQVATRPAQTNPAYAFSPNVSLPAAPPSRTGLQTLATTDQTNPGYGEQALNQTQNRLLEDPYAQTTQNLVGQASQPSAGQNYLNQNLGTLNGPGQGDQYWNQQQGQFQSPFAGEQYARTATQNMSPTGAAGAFNTQAQGQYGDFTGYTGAGNAQGQYGASSAQIGNGTVGQNNMANIASGYGANGQYTGQNLAAGQYAQTQGAFGDLPLPDSADPYYDRAIQLGTQTYNQGAAGRGVYGSSEALSGVGNVITDLNAKRAQTAFGNQMAIEQEQRARQELLGNQARMGDLSGTDAFAANMKGVETYGNLNNQMGQLQNQSMDILGQQANAADTQATAAQNSNIAGLSALGNIANNADRAGVDRYTASTNAMNNADRTAIDRVKTGADIAFGVDDSNRADYTAGANAASAAGSLDNNRLQTASSIANSGSTNDLARLNSYNQTAQGAEGQRQTRSQSMLDAVSKRDENIANIIGKAQQGLQGASQADFENYFTSTIAPYLNNSNMSEQQKQEFKAALMDTLHIIKDS
jgi:hypothetical protein